jgi:exopolysaccharide production protein ExoQ
MSMRGAGDRIGALPLRVVAELGFAFFVIYLLSGGPQEWLWIGEATTDSGSSPEGSPRLQALLALLYFVCLAIVLKRPRTWWRAIRSDLALVALLGWTLASVIWSQAPDVTLIRSIALLGTTFVGVYFAVRYPPETQLRLLGAALAVVVLYNAFLALAQLGMLGQGDFRGNFEHKNSLAKMMTLATVVFLCLATERRHRLVAIMAAVVSFGLVIVSGSATGLVVTLTLLILFPLLRLLTGDVRLVVVLGIAGLLVLGAGALVAPQALSVLAPALGRDVTLTGRTELWPVLVAIILQRPWLGYGYSAFWSGEEPALGISWRPTQAHNGFLEVALGLGVIGLGLFIFVLVRGVARAVVHVRQQRSASSYWPLVYFIFATLYNITEPTTLGRNNILWVLFVSALITVSPEWRRASGAPALDSQPARSHHQRHLVRPISRSSARST